MGPRFDLWRYGGSRVNALASSVWPRLDFGLTTRNYLRYSPMSASVTIKGTSAAMSLVYYQLNVTKTAWRDSLRCAYT